MKTQPTSSDYRTAQQKGKERAAELLGKLPSPTDDPRVVEAQTRRDELTSLLRETQASLVAVRSQRTEALETLTTAFVDGKTKEIKATREALSRVREREEELTDHAAALEVATRQNDTALAVAWLEAHNSSLPMLVSLKETAIREMFKLELEVTAARATAAVLQSTLGRARDNAGRQAGMFRAGGAV